MSGPPSLEEIIELSTTSQHALYWQVAATTVVFYDHVTTFDLELELIWKRKWSIVHALYFITRYLGGIGLLHGTVYQLWLQEGPIYENGCKHGALVQMSLSMIALWAMQSIIINRVWCMYSRSRTIIILLLTLFAAEITASLVVVGFNTDLKPTVIKISSTLLTCIPQGFSPWFWSFWCFIVVFDFVIFVLALAEGVKYVRQVHRRRAAQLCDQGSRDTHIGTLPWLAEQGSFIHVLLRDSIVFPFLTLMGCVANLLAWFEVLPTGSLQVTLVLAAMGSPILGCRLILNLRELYYQPFAAEFRPTLRKDSSRTDQTMGLPVVFAGSHQSSALSVP